MSKEKKDRKYSLPVRFLGTSCTFLLVGSVIYIAVAGLSYVSGFILAASLTGLVGPRVAAGDSFLEMLGCIFEIIVESIQTIFEAILDTISSIFG
jgi:hypothetical protein